MTSPAQSLVAVSVRKLQTARSARGGVDLRRSLLVTQVLQRARATCWLQAATKASDKVKAASQQVKDKSRHNKRPRADVTEVRDRQACRLAEQTSVLAEQERCADDCEPEQKRACAELTSQDSLVTSQDSLVPQLALHVSDMIADITDSSCGAVSSCDSSRDSSRDSSCDLGCAGEVQGGLPSRPMVMVSV